MSTKALAFKGRDTELHSSLGPRVIPYLVVVKVILYGLHSWARKERKRLVLRLVLLACSET